MINKIKNQLFVKELVFSQKSSWWWSKPWPFLWAFFINFEDFLCSETTIYYLRLFFSVIILKEQSRSHHKCWKLRKSCWENVTLIEKRNHAFRFIFSFIEALRKQIMVPRNYFSKHTKISVENTSFLAYLSRAL